MGSSKGYLHVIIAIFLTFSLTACFDSGTSDNDNSSGDDGQVTDLALDLELPDEPGPGDIPSEEPAPPIGDTADPPVVEVPSLPADVIPIRMKVEYGSSLGISWFPEFNYDAENSQGIGTVADLGNGKGYVSFPEGALIVDDLEFIPGLVPWTDALPITEKIRIEINVNDFSGEMDFCTGEINMDFDAQFQARMEFIEPWYGMVDEIIVICNMTTGVSTGETDSLEGSPLLDNGRFTLAGVATVPVTEDWLVNIFLSLPTDARVLMNARFDFPEGRLECPGQTPPANPDVTLSVGRHGSIKFKKKNEDITDVPFVQYDGKDTLLATQAGPVNNDGIAFVNFGTSEIDVPDIDLNPFPLGIDRFSVKITQLQGEIDYCSGQMDLFGVVEYRWKLLGLTVPFTKKTVECMFTTDTSYGRYCNITGERTDQWGDGTLVTVEPIQFGVWPFSIVKDVIVELPYNLKVDKDLDLCNPL